jgi:hypothetical protein
MGEENIGEWKDEFYMVGEKTWDNQLKERGHCMTLTQVAL